MANTKQELILNVLSFAHPQKKISVHFYKENIGNTMYPLQRHEFPIAFNGMDPNPVEGLDYIYTDFEKQEDTDLQITVNLDRSTNFAAHYYNYCTYKAMKGIADYRRRTFIRNNQCWFRDEAHDHGGLQAYKKFSIRASVRRYTEGPELTVMYDGRSYVYPQSIHQYPGPTTELNYVLYKGYCFKYEDIPADADIDYTEVFPVVNHDMRIRLNTFLPFKPGRNKVKKYYDQIEWFRKKCLMAPAFQEYIPVKPEWMQIRKGHYKRTSYKNNMLLFGKGKTDIRPLNGINKYGPFKPPKHRHFKIFFIVHENDRKKIANELYRYLNGDYSQKFKGLARYVNMPMELSEDHLVFTDAENPVPEVSRKLQHMAFDPAVQYLAIYLSPISKQEQDPQKSRVYYRIKEELLKYRITSQVIERQKVLKSNFRYALPNIAVAILAKLGGIPWQLNDPPRSELIVGVGAFKPRDMNKRYVGNAFCFSNNGTFQGFRCYTHDETDMLAGSIRKAVRTYVEEASDLKRLVIHFYKRMSYRERKPIMAMLHNLGLEIPVVVVSINKTASRDIVLFDQNSSEKIPVSGIYTRLKDRTILLCNNTRYRAHASSLRSYPFPVKLRMSCTDENLLKDWDEVNRLVEQVYKFSRVYWKSVSQQNLPVTIKYPEMVAEMFPYFESETIPSFGQKNLWFL